MNNNECLCYKTGTCGGCEVVQIALKRAPAVHDRERLGQVARETARPTQSIW